MFTGIIEGLGTVRRMRPRGAGKELVIHSGFALDETKIGDSIAVNGACLTAVSVEGRDFKADVSPETLSKTAIGALKIGDRVNMERALRISGRLDGHLVSGHVDCMGKIERKRETGNAVIVIIDLPESFAEYIIKKGSVAVDGISLTVNDCRQKSFEVSVIPLTAEKTTIGFKKPGQPVNIETDMIGKYVERFVTGRAGGLPGNKKPGVGIETLLRNGFL